MTDDERAAAFRALGNELEPGAKELWAQYAELELKGLRKSALQALREFVAEMQHSNAKADWTWLFCETATRAWGPNWYGPGDGFPVRQPLWEELLLPALVEGYRQGRPGAATYLGLREVSGEALGLTDLPSDPADLLREVLRANPDDHLAREKLLYILFRRMDFVIHEAPHHGVLMADIDEDIRIANELEDLARAAGKEDQYADFIFSFRYYTTTWNEYMKRRTEFSSFVDFLNRAAPFIPLSDATRQTNG